MRRPKPRDAPVMNQVCCKDWSIGLQPAPPFADCRDHPNCGNGGPTGMATQGRAVMRVPGRWRIGAVGAVEEFRAAA